MYAPWRGRHTNLSNRNQLKRSTPPRNAEGRERLSQGPEVKTASATQNTAHVQECDEQDEDDDNLDDGGERVGNAESANEGIDGPPDHARHDDEDQNTDEQGHEGFPRLDGNPQQGERLPSGFLMPLAPALTGLQPGNPLPEAHNPVSKPCHDRSANYGNDRKYDLAWVHLT